MKESPRTEINLNKLQFKLISMDDFHHLRNFKCGNGSMENFLQMEAYPSHIERIASTTLVFYEDKLVA